MNHSDSLDSGTVHVGEPSRVLVTGAAGFIGSRVLPILVDLGYDVHAVSRFPRVSNNNVTWHCTDLLDRKDSVNLIHAVSPKVMLHLAWVTDHGSFWGSPENEIWATATEFLARSFVSEGGDRFVASGTCAEYDWTSGVMNEDLTPCKPLTAYGRAKLEVFEKLVDLAHSNDFTFGWGRIFHLYGPGEHPNRLIPYVVRSLKAGEIAHISGGSKVRDFMYVDDVAGSLVALLESTVSGPVNLASGTGHKISKMVEQVALSLGRPDLICYDTNSDSSGDPDLLVADVNRLRNTVKYHAKWSIRDGLLETVKWWGEEISSRDCARLSLVTD